LLNLKNLPEELSEILYEYICNISLNVNVVLNCIDLSTDKFNTCVYGQINNARKLVKKIK